MAANPVHFNAGSELGPVPWPPTDLPCCEAAVLPCGVAASSEVAVVGARILFGRHSTVGSELARTRGIRLSN